MNDPYDYKTDAELADRSFDPGRDDQTPVTTNSDYAATHQGEQEQKDETDGRD